MSNERDRRRSESRANPPQGLGLRSPAQTDRDRLLYSDALRRLQGVTQVVSADEGWVFHNRLTHSIKVAQVARRIAEHLEKTSDPDLVTKVGGLDVDVAEAAGLAHDLGHPPFGHVAEETLQEMAGDVHFEGNAQSFRIVTSLEPHGGDYRGLDLTRSTLNAILKYPFPRHERGGITRRKYGYYFRSEQGAFAFAREFHKDSHKSLEAEIMDFADDITFAIHDTEDFYRAGMIPLHDLRPGHPEFDRLIEDIKERWKSRGVRFEDEWNDHIDALTEVFLLMPMSSVFYGTLGERVILRQVMSGRIGDYVTNGIILNDSYVPGAPRVVIDHSIGMQLRMLKELTWTYVINRPSLATQQVGHRAVVKGLFEHFVDEIQRARLSTIPPQFHNVINQRDPGQETDQRLAADIICSLTDRQALILFQRITGLNPGVMVPLVL